MSKNYDYQKKNTGSGSSFNKGQRKSGERTYKGATSKSNTSKTGNSRSNSSTSSVHNKSYNKSNYTRNNYRDKYSSIKNLKRVKEDETIEDIKADILRIEKEIELELKGIRSLKL